MAKILLIEDSLDMASLVEMGLSPYTIQHATTLAMAEELLEKNDYDLVLIDITLPDGNGFDLCLRLSQDSRYARVPRILLTGMDQASEKVYGFSCGADDYVTKPFHVMELKARVDRFLTRSLQAESVQVYHGFEFNIPFQKCARVIDGRREDLGLTPTEFRLFLTLIKSEGLVLSRQALEKVGWESQGTVIELRGIDTHIAHLRKKLGDMRERIVSVYGQGYAYALPEEKKNAA